MNINYHTHCTFDKHSKMTIEESIEKAIKLGFKKWGISGHMWMTDDDSNNRISSGEEFKKYMDELKIARKKYENKIKIYIGVETECENPYNGDSVYKDGLEIEDNIDLDYSILGNHIYWNTEFGPKDNMTKEEIDKHVNGFALAAQKYKKLLYFAHPDSYICGYSKFNKEAKEIAKKIIEISIKYNKPLGINGSGLKHKKAYPSHDFFKLAGEMGAKCIFEFDAHSLDIISTEVIDDLEEFANLHKLKIVDDLI